MRRPKLVALVAVLGLAGGMLGLMPAQAGHDDDIHSDNVKLLTRKPIKAGDSSTYSFTAGADPQLGMYHAHHHGHVAIVNGLGTPTHSSVLDYLDQNGVPDLFVASGSRSWNQPDKYPGTFGFNPERTG